MTDKTVDQLQEEIQKLQDKNTQLIAEKRKAQSERDEVAERLASVEKERDEVAGKYHHLTVELPRQEVLESVAVDGAADLLWRELTHHYDVVRNDEGQDVLHDKEGQPLELNGQPLLLDVDGIRKLHESGRVRTIGNLIKGSGATGGGATGGSRSTPRQAKPSADAPVRFGMR